VQVDVGLILQEPPEYLWHGTAEKSVSSIRTWGLKPQSRLYVHLSRDYDTAVKVGSRHGKPVICRVRARQMHRDGYVFYLSANNVWLTQWVPAGYLEWD
jgi:putative RNA 2'-phosphotransferase